MNVTSVILNWNGKKWLEQFLPAVLATEYPHHEILVIDNASTDDSVSWMQAQYPRVRVVVLDKNYGFTGGNNRALPHIHTPYFVLLNSDVEVSPDWLRPLVERMEANPKLAALQPKIRAWRDKDKFEHAGACGGFLDTLAYPYCRGRLFQHTEIDQGQYDDYSEIFWATGACMMLRKSVVDELDLFEESFFAHMEEIDFCWRAKNRGYSVGVEPQSVVWHVGGATLDTESPFKLFLNLRNSLAMMARNLPAFQAFGKVFARLVLDGVFGVKLLLEGKFLLVWTIIKAHFAFYGMLPSVFAARKKYYPEGVASMPKVGVFSGSIVWQHFIKRKKTYGEIENSKS